MNLSQFELVVNNGNVFPDLYGERLNLRFFVGPNGSGKSHVLEAIGLIFSSLIYQINVDLSFAVEYELQERAVRIVSTLNVPQTVSETWFNRNPPRINSRRGFGVYIKERDQNEWVYVEDPNPDLYCPSRVVAVASGPTTGFHWAMYERPLAYLVESVQGEWGDDVGLSLEDQLAMESDARARWDTLLDRPQVLVMNPQDCRYAVLSALLLADEGPSAEQLGDLSREAGIQPQLGSFSFIVSGDWHERLQDPLRSRVRELLGSATVRWVHVQGPQRLQTQPLVDAPPDFLAAYDVTPGLIELFKSELRLSTMGLFMLLMACRRRGVIRDMHLGLIPDKDLDDQADKGLLPEDALSDGEYLRIGRYCLLWMLREERDCVILLDEPETHFNDLWKIGLVSDVVRLMRPGYREEAGSAEILIATHSAITLTDAESSQVYGFYNGKHVPTVRTFGAGTDDITRGVYGANPSQGRFAVSLIEAAIRTRDIGTLQRLKRTLAPGYYHFRVTEVLDELLEGGSHASSNNIGR